MLQRRIGYAGMGRHSNGSGKVQAIPGGFENGIGGRHVSQDKIAVLRPNVKPYMFSSSVAAPWEL